MSKNRDSLTDRTRSSLKTPRRSRVLGTLVIAAVATQLSGCGCSSTTTATCSATPTAQACVDMYGSAAPGFHTGCCEQDQSVTCTTFRPKTQDCAAHPECAISPEGCGAAENSAAQQVGGGISAGETATAGILEADKLEGPNEANAADPTATVAEGVQAGAEDGGEIKGLSNGSGSGEQAGGLKGNLGTGKLGQGSGSGSGSSGSKGGVQSGGTAAMNPNPEASLAAAEQGQQLENTGLYKNGKGKGAAGSGSGSGALSFGSSSDTGGGDASSLSFGSENSEAGKSGDSQSATEDPEDYFTRIGIDESLFKRVERKHTEKQRYWLNENRPGKLK